MLQTPIDTQQKIENKGDRDKFLRRVIRDDCWTMQARAANGWKITFARTIKGGPGDADCEVIVVLSDKITLTGHFGKHRSFSDADEVFIPTPQCVRLRYSSVKTLAKFLLDGSNIAIHGSSGSTESSKLGIATLKILASVKDCGDSVMIGHESIYVHGKTIVCGSVQ